VKALKAALAVAVVGLVALFSAPAIASSSVKLTARQFESAAQKDVNKQFPQDNEPGESTQCAYVQSVARTGYVFTCVTLNKDGKQLASTQVTLTQPIGGTVKWDYLVTAPTFPSVTYTVTAVDGSTATITYADGTVTVHKDHAHLPFTVIASGSALPSIIAYDSPKVSSASITCTMVVTGSPPVTNTGPGSYSVAWCY
jgi:hypothetical protein